MGQAIRTSLGHGAITFVLQTQSDFDISDISLQYRFNVMEGHGWGWDIGWLVVLGLTAL